MIAARDQSIGVVFIVKIYHDLSFCLWFSCVVVLLRVGFVGCAVHFGAKGMIDSNLTTRKERTWVSPRLLIHLSQWLNCATSDLSNEDTVHLTIHLKILPPLKDKKEAKHEKKNPKR